MNLRDRSSKVSLDMLRLVLEDWKAEKRDQWRQANVQMQQDEPKSRMQRVPRQFDGQPGGVVAVVREVDRSVVLELAAFSTLNHCLVYIGTFEREVAPIQLNTFASMLRIDIPPAFQWVSKEARWEELDPSTFEGRPVHVASTA